MSISAQCIISEAFKRLINKEENKSKIIHTYHLNLKKYYIGDKLWLFERRQLKYLKDINTCRKLEALYLDIDCDKIDQALSQVFR